MAKLAIKFTIGAGLLSLMVFGFGTEASAQTVERYISPAQKWAEDTAKIAGGALYCSFEEDSVENYISRALAMIAAESDDDVEQVVARFHFSTILSKASASVPEGGCENFLIVFEAEFEKLGEALG